MTKKIFISLVFTVFLISNSWALFGISLFGKKDYSLFKKETHDKIENMKSEMNGVKSTIGDITTEVTGIKSSIGTMENSLTAKIQARVSAVDKSTNNDISSGRDSINTNDTQLMKYIFGGIIGALIILIKILAFIIIMLVRTISKDSAYKNRIIDEALDIAQNKKLGVKK